MDNHYQELMHFVANNVDEVICRSWAKDIRRMEKAERNCDKLREALAGILDRYTELVNCGDCGNWDCEKEREVIEARAAIEAMEMSPCPDGGKCHKQGDKCGDPICVEWNADLLAEEEEGNE